jgi:hypothetical protein
MEVLMRLLRPIAPFSESDDLMARTTGIKLMESLVWTLRHVYTSISEEAVNPVIEIPIKEAFDAMEQLGSVLFGQPTIVTDELTQFMHVFQDRFEDEMQILFPFVFPILHLALSAISNHERPMQATRHDLEFVVHRELCVTLSDITKCR